MQIFRVAKLKPSLIALLGILITSSFSICQAQKYEAGIQIHNPSNGPRQFFSHPWDITSSGFPTYFFMDGGVFFKATNSKSQYIRASFDLIRNAGSNQITDYQSNNWLYDHSAQFSSTAIRAGIEMGHIWEIHPRIRVQVGAQVNIGKGFRFEESFVTTITDDQGDEVSLRATDANYQGSLVSNVLLAGRIDYRFCKQLRVGLNMNYGLTTSFNDYDYVEQRRLYESGILVEETTNREERNASFKYGFSRLSLPTITLGYSFGKSNSKTTVQ